MRTTSDCDQQATTRVRRDPLLDLLRSGALVVVVLWHWVFATIRWADDGPHVGNPVAATPGLWLLTWVFQVMPLFFIVGGALHARSLRRPGGADGFVRRRLCRLVLPVLPLVLPAAAALGWAVAAGRADLARAIVLVISPLWFLATYVACVAAAPLADRLDRRFGAAAPVLGVAAAILVAHLRFTHGWGGPAMVLTSYCVVWLTVHQLGWSFDRLRAAARRTRLQVAAAGVAAMAALVVLGGYPGAMVGVDGQRVSNMGPPTLMVLALATGQLGAATAAAGPLGRLAARHRRSLEVAGEWSLTVYVWHLVAFSAFWVLARVAIGPMSHHVDAGWWWQRPVWLIGPALVAVPLCRATRRLDPSGRRSSVSSRP